MYDVNIAYKKGRIDRRLSANAVSTEASILHRIMWEYDRIQQNLDYCGGCRGLFQGKMQALAWRLDYNHENIRIPHLLNTTYKRYRFSQLARKYT
jgi:hypothetical protein